MDSSEERRDKFNKKIARESSWMCKIFQENEVDVLTKKAILIDLLQQQKQKLEKYNGSQKRTS